MGSGVLRLKIVRPAYLSPYGATRHAILPAASTWEESRSIVITVRNGLDSRETEYAHCQEDRRFLPALLVDTTHVRRGRPAQGDHGCENVFDFSLGNPNVEPPLEFQRVIEELVHDPAPGLHGYMPNAGYPETREAVACFLSEDQGVDVPGANVVMTVGAGGALNVILKAILDPGDEVIVPRPYFVEYGFYADNHGGALRPVDSAPDFGLDIQAIEAAIHDKTRAILLNSPNNPTGRVYPADSLAVLGDLLRRKTRETGRLIYLISDEPYRRIVYDGVRVPPVMAAYENSVIASSYSKELSLAASGSATSLPALPYRAWRRSWRG